MNARLLPLVAVFSLSAVTAGVADPAASPSPSPSAAQPAGLAATLQARMIQQCGLITSGDYDGYLATLSPDFRRTGPFAQQDESRDRIAAGFKKAQGLGMRQTGCTVRVISAVPTPSGAYARFYETDQESMGKVTLDIDTDAGADFVKGADGAWIEHDVHRAGFKFVLGSLVIHQEGTIDGVTVGPANLPTPDPSQKLSQISITMCRFFPGRNTVSGVWTRTKYGPQYSSNSSYAPDGVVVNFVNEGSSAAERVTFAIRFRGVLDSTPNTTSAVAAGASSHWTFPVKAADRSGYVQLPVTCSIQNVVRADGTEWPSAPPSPASSPSPAA